MEGWRDGGREGKNDFDMCTVIKRLRYSRCTVYLAQ